MTKTEQLETEVDMWYLSLEDLEQWNIIYQAFLKAREEDENGRENTR